MSRNYRSKHEADEFADSVKKKARNPQEVQLKGYHIASLYCEVHEYKSALPYAESYVTIKPADPRGWKLVGFIYENLKNPAKAIESYRRSLELNDYQKELVLKVAELYCEVNYEAEKHRYWAERAEKYYPNHRIIHKIREHILRSGKNLREYEKYLRDKLRSNSRDIYLNIKLVDILLETSQLREGYQHCAAVGDSSLFDSDPRWWQKAAVFYKTMIGQQSGQPESVIVQVYSRLLLAVNSLVTLGLAKSSAPPSHNMLQIQAMDKVLLQTSDFLPTTGNALQRPQGDAVVQEVKGQLFFHLATLYLKMAVVGSVSLSDVVEMAAACYITSLQVAPCQAASALTLKKDRMDSLTLRLRRLGAERMSEVCHMLTGLARQHDEDWLEACRDRCCSRQGRQRLFEQIYGIQNPDPRQSFLMMDDAFVQSSPVQLPDMVETVFKYDKASLDGGSANLQRLVWLGLQWDIRKDGVLPDLGSFMEVTFDRLAISSRRLDNTSVDNLCIMDLEAFLYASIYVARAQLRNLHQEGLADFNIPAALLVNAYSEEQLDWYMSVYQLYSGKAKPSDLGKLRLTAKKGLEVLRCQKNHGMETMLLVELGRTFNGRADELRRATSDPNDRRERREAYQEMSMLYWQAAQEHLKMMASKRAVLHPKKPMFSHVHKPIEDAQIAQLLDEGAVVIAESSFAKGQHQVALSHLAKAKTGKALFAKAVMQHALASMETEGRSIGRITTDILKKQGDLLDQSKHTLFLTMDCIDSEPRNPLHEEVQSLLEEIEQEQASILDQVNAVENNQLDVSNLSSSRHSFLGETPAGPRTSSRDFDSPFRQSMRGGSQSTSQAQHIEQLSPDPSPRRLAAEVRALNLSHSHLLDQNQRLMQREDKLMENNAELMKQILQLTKDLQEVKLQQARSMGQSAAPAPAPASTPAPAVPATPPRQTAPPAPAPSTPTPQVAQPIPQQHPQQVLASRQTASPSVPPNPSRTLYQPHPAYHPLDAGAYYHPHMMPPSPMPGGGGQAWYPSAYGVPSPVPNAAAAAYYPQHYGVPAYDRGGAVHPGMLASTPRSTSRGPLESLYGMYSSIGASPEDKNADQLAAMQGLKQQQQQQQPASPAAGYPQRQLLVTGAAGAASIQGASPGIQGASPTIQGASPVIQGASPMKPGVEVEEKMPSARGLGAGLSADKPQLMFKGGSITSGTPPRSQGTAPPAMFSPAAPAAATNKALITPDRGIENVTPPTAIAGASPFTAAGAPTKPLVEAVKPTPQPGLFKTDVGIGVANPSAPPPSQPQFGGFTSNPTAATSKPSQTFGNFSFSPSTIKPAPSVGKPATTSASAPSPFAGFSFGISTTSASTSSTISSAGVFKPAMSAKSAAVQPGGSPAAFGKPDLTADPRSLSPYPGFYASPQAHAGGAQGDQTPSPARKPGQSPLSRDTAPPKTMDSPKSVSFKPEVDDDDVIFLSMTQPPSDLRARAERLYLPAGFYLYETKPPCRGCIGCIEDLDIDSLYRKPGDSMDAPVVRPKEPTPSAFGASGGFAQPAGGGFFGGGDSGSGMSFATLAANQEDPFGGGFGKKSNDGPFSFANAGAPVFGGGAQGGDRDDHGGDDEYDPHYEAIVSLPDIGAISTGEEDEDQMFRHRAKLFRFDRDAKTWKERGVGDIKIQRNPKTGRARVLMRRDQIFKLCANHWITTEMELKPMMASDTAWVWVAVDFSEEEPKNEQLAVKFKHAEHARAFRDAFEKAQAMLGDAEQVADQPPEQDQTKKGSTTASVTEAFPQLTSLLLGSSMATEATEKEAVGKANPQLMGLLMGPDKTASKKSDASDSIAARFAKKAGTWDCEACYTNNSGDSQACVACATPKPGAKQAPTATFGASAPASATGASSSIAAKFANKPGSWDCEACYTNNSGESQACVACATPKPGAKQAPTATFGASAPASATGASSSIAAKFANKPGSWDCDACYTNNSSQSQACIACATPKPGAMALPAATASAIGGTTGGAFKLPSGFSLQQQPSAPSTGLSFGAKPSGAPSAGFKLPTGFNLSQSSTTTDGTSAPNAAPSSTTTTNGAPSSGFKVPSGFNLASQQPASTGFAFGSKKVDAPKPTEGTPTKAAPPPSDGATTPGGTLTTDKFTFGTGMPQFSFIGEAEPTQQGTGFAFGGKPAAKPAATTDTKTGFAFPTAVKPPGESQSTSATPTKPGLTFADLAKSKGSSFSFRMDFDAIAAKSPIKSPGAKSPGGRSPKTSFSRSRTISGGDGEEEVEQGDDIYFEPIVQMPDDYEVKTGEEGEDVKFSHRAKLFRYDGDSKQWKERGVGDIKVLYNREDDDYRIVMRRDQVFKVCANHYITPAIELRPNANSDRSWVWSAMDASEGAVQNEQLAVRFKTADTAKDFKTAVEKAKEHIEKQGKGDQEVSSSTDVETPVPEVKSCDPKLSASIAQILKDSPFQQKPSSSKASSDVPSTSQSVSSSSHTGDEVNPEEERDIHFQPIVKLPDKVDLVTGEEEETPSFVARGKLYRFDTASRQWKERGVGDMKIMHSRENDVYRIVMRREQIHKVCANHYITATMSMNPMSGSDRAWVWHAMDAADGEPTSEQLAIRFKDAAIAANFKDKFETAQERIRQRGGDGERNDDEGVGGTSDATAPTTLSGDAAVATATASSQGKAEILQVRNEETEEGKEVEDDDDEEDDDDDDDGENSTDDDDEEENEEKEEKGALGSFVSWVKDKLDGSDDSRSSSPSSSSGTSSSSSSNQEADAKED